MRLGEAIIRCRNTHFSDSEVDLESGSFGSTVLPAAVSNATASANYPDRYCNDNQSSRQLPLHQKQECAHSSEKGNSSRQNTMKVGSWHNVHIHTAYGAVLDAAAIMAPEQGEKPPEQQKWILYLVANGEVFEFLFDELRALAFESGVSVFVINYRSVSNSTGLVTCASDLVEDAIAALDYMCTRMNLHPEHVLIFGRSLGGAVGALARRCHSPTGPIVIDRSFSSLPRAGRALLCMILSSVLNTDVHLPEWLVNGLLASIFKGDM